MDSISGSDSVAVKEISRDKTLDAIGFLINELVEEYNLDYNEIIDLISKRQKRFLVNYIPLEALSNRALGILQSIVKFLREERSMSFDDIAKKLNRDNRTIWSTYHNAVKKFKKRLDYQSGKILIPVEIFSDRRLGALEALSLYLHDKQRMSFREIGRALNRNERTIWTSYSKAKKKRASNGK